jgi:hypothetical protein
MAFGARLSGCVAILHCRQREGKRFSAKDLPGCRAGI